MARSTLLASVVAAALAGAGVPLPAQRAPAPLKIDQLIDIKPPSNPVWPPDSRRIAFTWERAGVANLYVVPADGSSAPLQVTKDGVPPGVFWSPDGQSLLFFRGGAALMTLPLDGSAPTPRFADFAPRSPAVSRDGTRVAYLAAGGAIRLRSLVDGSDTLVATVTEPIETVSWATDTTLVLADGSGRGETRRHEQTPEYSGSKIIYTITERRPGAPAATWTLPVAGGSPQRYSGAGGFGGRGNRWIDATHFLIDRQSPDYKRRSILVGSTGGGEPVPLHEDVKEKFWSMTGDARGGSQPSPDGKWVAFVSDRDGWDHVYVVT